MATLEPRPVCSALPNVGCRSEATIALDADMKSFTISKDIVEPASVKDLVESVIPILARFGDEIIKEHSLVELPGLCSKTCHVPKTVDDLDGRSDHIENLGRAVSNTESAVGERANCAINLREHPHVPTEECINTRRKEFGSIPNFINARHCQPTAPALQPLNRTSQEASKRGSSLKPGSALEHDHARKPLDSEPGSPLAPVMHTPVSFIGNCLGPLNSRQRECAKRSDEPTHIDSAVPTPGQPGDVNHIPESPLKRALQRFVSSSVSEDEIYRLINTTISQVEPMDIVKCVETSDDAQAFIDMMGEALETMHFAPKVRRKCIRSLYKMCAGHTLLPSSLRFELPEGTMGAAQYRGGSADVLKRKCGGRDVAVKALRARGTSSEGMRNRFCKEVITWKTLRHPNVLRLLGAIMIENQFSMVSEWMANGNIKEFTAAHWDANRFELLSDVGRGLVHMHGQGMIHGDLKGANILIDGAGHACLADFGLLTITSDLTNTTWPNSFLGGGTSRWMSPELFDPEKFNLKDCRPTKSSDRYAFGMVMYEVLSGRTPFSKCHDYVVVAKVLKGERPARPQGGWITDGIWSMLKNFWEPNPGDRPKIKVALQYLGEVSRSWVPFQGGADTPTATSPTRNRESSTGESTDEGETTSSSRSSRHGDGGSGWKPPLPAPLINAPRKPLPKISVDQGSLNGLRVGRRPAAATLGRSISDGNVLVPIERPCPDVRSHWQPGLKVRNSGVQRWGEVDG